MTQPERRTRRVAPLTPEFCEPYCPMCGDQTEVDSDGDLSCAPCGALWPVRDYWDPSRSHGGAWFEAQYGPTMDDFFDDPESAEAQCAIKHWVRPVNLWGFDDPWLRTWQCVRTVAHTGEHVDEEGRRWLTEEKDELVPSLASTAALRRRRPASRTVHTISVREDLL